MAVIGMLVRLKADVLEGGTSTPPGSPPQTAYYRTLPNYSAPSSSSNQVLASDSSNVVSSSPTKRKYIPDSQDLDIVKKIRQNEVELRDRTTVLRGIKANVSALPFILSCCKIPLFEG